MQQRAHGETVELIGRICNKKGMDDVPQIFNRPLLAARRSRAAASWAEHRFLLDETGARLLDRLDDIKRSFPIAVNWGAGDGALTPHLLKKSGIKQVQQTEISPELAKLAAKQGPVVVADEEQFPLAPQSCDLIVSNLVLHWVNDLPGALTQARLALRPDGLFLASLFGGETLRELRQCFYEAEMELVSGIASRFSPLIEIRDAGGLLQRAGFALPVADREFITVDYASPLKLLADLQGMAATNLLHTRHPLRREVLARALALYSEKFGTASGGVDATFEIITLSGWSPHESQQQPLKPGSAQHSLSEALRD